MTLELYKTGEITGIQARGEAVNEIDEGQKGMKVVD